MLMTDLSREGFGRPPLVPPNSPFESGGFCLFDNSITLPETPGMGRKCSRD